MKTFKILDLIVQLSTILLGVFACLLNIDNLFQTYLIVGGWQIFSCLVHGSIGGWYSYSGRRKYLWTLAIVIFLGIASLASMLLYEKIIFLYLEFLLIFSPLMALWYCFICYKEIKLYQQKEWIQLK